MPKGELCVQFGAKKAQQKDVVVLAVGGFTAKEFFFMKFQ